VRYTCGVTGDEVLVAAARVLNSAAIHLLRGMRAADRVSGLTPARLSVLSVLVFGGPMTLKGLATAEGVSSPTMTRIVDGLVGRGLATRTTHPDSARQVLVGATPAGEELMTRAAERRFALIVSALEKLDPGRREQLVAAAPVLRELAGLLPRTPP
jgi:DNA-binding MarR family transcriptional regulator